MEAILLRVVIVMLSLFAAAVVMFGFLGVVGKLGRLFRVW